MSDESVINQRLIEIVGEILVQDSFVHQQIYTHNVSDFLKEADECGLGLVRFNEWWHHEDQPGSVPRLATFLFRRPSGGAAA